MSIKALFLDVGGVLMTNGWDRQLRKQTAEKFGLDFEEFTKRHELVFDLFERGKITFDAYLDWTCFYEKRSFTPNDIKHFIFEAVRPFPEMLAYVKELKEKYRLKIGVISNEGREIGVDRIARFNLGSFVDFFFLSAFVGYRKPDHDIYRLAIDAIQLPPKEICYIDDRSMLIESAQVFGLKTIQYVDFESTKRQLDLFLTNA